MSHELKNPVLLENCIQIDSEVTFEISRREFTHGLVINGLPYAMKFYGTIEGINKKAVSTIPDWCVTLCKISGDDVNIEGDLANDFVENCKWQGIGFERQYDAEAHEHFLRLIERCVECFSKEDKQNILYMNKEYTDKELSIQIIDGPSFSLYTRKDGEKILPLHSSLRTFKVTRIQLSSILKDYVQVFDEGYKEEMNRFYKKAWHGENREEENYYRRKLKYR